VGSRARRRVAGAGHRHAALTRQAPDPPASFRPTMSDRRYRRDGSRLVLLALSTTLSRTPRGLELEPEGSFHDSYELVTHDELVVVARVR